MTDLQQTYSALVELYRPYQDKLDIPVNEAQHIELYTRHIMDNGKALYFGGAKVLSKTVSFHFMPIYVYPELFDNVPAELKKKLKGKSCFHFTELTPEIARQLTELLKLGFDKYRQDFDI